MKKSILVLILLAGTLSLSGQYPRSMRIRQLDERTIYIAPAHPYGPPGKMLAVRHGIFSRIYMNGWMIDNSYATMLMAEHPQAYTAIRRANTNLTWACVSATAGTVGIAWTLIDWASRPPKEFKGEFWDNERRSVNWVPAVVGAVLWIAVFPLVSGYNRQLERAVGLYNRSLGLSAGSGLRKPYLAPAEGGIGLALHF